MIVGAAGGGRGPNQPAHCPRMIAEIVSRNLLAPIRPKLTSSRRFYVTNRYFLVCDRMDSS